MLRILLTVPPSMPTLTKLFCFNTLRNTSGIRHIIRFSDSRNRRYSASAEVRSRKGPLICQSRNFTERVLLITSPLLHPLQHYQKTVLLHALPIISTSRRANVPLSRPRTPQSSTNQNRLWVPTNHKILVVNAY